MQRYDEIVATSATAGRAAHAGSPRKLAETLVDEAPMHRLWYDLRSQSMFEEALRGRRGGDRRRAERMIWRVVERYACAGRAGAGGRPGDRVRAAGRDLRAGAARATCAASEAAAGRLVARAEQVLPMFLGPAIR